MQFCLPFRARVDVAPRNYVKIAVNHEVLASVLLITHYVRAFSEPPNPPGCEPPGKPRQLCPWLWSSTPRLLWLLHLLKAATNHGLTPQPHCWSELSKTFPRQHFPSQMKDPGCTVPWLPDKSAICTGEYICHMHWWAGKKTERSYCRCYHMNPYSKISSFFLKSN